MNPKKKVLLIDDDLMLMQTAKQLLESSGFEVLTRESGFDSTNFVARHQPDLVLLDVNMPFLSGDRLFQIFREHRSASRVPVVFFSSNDENSLRKLVKDTGALGYIAKSEMGMSLAAKVAYYIEQSAKSA